MVSRGVNPCLGGHHDLGSSSLSLALNACADQCVVSCHGFTGALLRSRWASFFLSRIDWALLFVEMGPADRSVEGVHLPFALASHLVRFPARLCFWTGPCLRCWSFPMSKSCTMTFGPCFGALLFWRGASCMLPILNEIYCGFSRQKKPWSGP